jgi:hypothetical protein
MSPSTGAAEDLRTTAVAAAVVLAAVATAAAFGMGTVRSKRRPLGLAGPPRARDFVIVSQESRKGRGLGSASRLKPK